MRRVKPEANGTAVPLSLPKTLLSAGWGFVCMGVAAFGLFGGAWVTLAGLGFFPVHENRAVVLLGGLGLIVLSLGILALGGAVVAAEVIDYLRDERYVIGGTALQRLRGRDDVQEHIPFDNVEELRIGVYRLYSRQPFLFIGVKLLDPRRKDTRLNPKRRRVARKVHHFDCVILDCYELSLEDFCRKLRTRWRQLRTRAPRPGPAAGVEDAEEWP